MIPIPTLLAGIAFVLLAALNVGVMLEASRPTCSGKLKSRLVVLHRIGGYLFVVVLCIMVGIMSDRLVGIGLSKAPLYLVLHVTTALALVPLVALKLLIARRYKHLHALLMPLGMSIFAASFLLVALPVLSEVLRSATSEGIGSRLSWVTTIVVSLILCALAIKRMKRQADRALQSLRIPPTPLASSPSTSSQGVPRPLMTLLLTHIEQQTHDTKTLRFLVPRERIVGAKPGQFLTFHWSVNGNRVLRSYTISSSPNDDNYVEITPKRTQNGYVSTFLNDTAAIGLAVEASGPYGRFYFDEDVHTSIVLIAGGSGITPMISMVRYIRDRGLSTPVTLLYCVRTAKDIIFKTELEALREALPNFQYHVCLSQPDDVWKGRRGHITPEFIGETVTGFESHTFFLCGPPPFMDTARRILRECGVRESQIHQESFGDKSISKVAQNMNPVSDMIEFASSRKSCALIVGRTLLEMAEINGVDIPFGCRQGECGTCATKVLRGSVQMDRDAGLSAEQKAAGYVLPCVSRAQGAVVLAV